MSSPAAKHATAQPQSGCTLEAYAAAKRLPEEFLRRLGLKDWTLFRVPALRVPYLDETGAEVAVRFRVELLKGEQVDNRFRWRSGDKPRLYGLSRLQEARAAQHVVLVEGESDSQTLWLHGVPALGIPGAGNWREEWASALDGIATIYVVIEPDKGGEAVRAWLGRSRIRDRVRLVELAQVKDPSDLHVQDPAAFGERWEAALKSAVSWTDQAAEEAVARKQAAWVQCAALARSPRILDCLAEALPAAGLVGEERAAKLVYLCGTSRFFGRPVSAVVKGPSSAGKSYVTERALGFLPQSAYYPLTAMSERSLAYSDEPLKHRMLVLYEAAGMQGEFASYLIRSLLSEGRVRYETVEKTPKGLQPRLIEREGPTGLLVTTTAIRLHNEVETRLFSIPISDSPEQTRLVLAALATERKAAVDMGPWHALQEWLVLSEHRVTIPFAPQLARLVPAVAVRLRRDFGAVLSLINAHALLHQASRSRDEQGQIIATLDDYAVVRELVGDLIAEGVQSAVPPAVRETVESVTTLQSGGEGVTALAVAKYLKLDKSSASRRLRDAGERGYVTNTEQRRGQPGRWVIADPLPTELEVLPAPLMLEGGCAVARAPEDDTPARPPSGDVDGADQEAGHDVVEPQPPAPGPGDLVDGVEEALRCFGWDPVDGAEVLDESEDGSTDGPIAGCARKRDPEVLLPLALADPQVATAGMHDGSQPRRLRLDEEAIPAAQAACGRPESAHAESASDAAEVEARLRPQESAPPRVPEDDRATGGGDDACSDCGGRLLHWEFGDLCTQCHHRFALPDDSVTPAGGPRPVAQGSAG